MPHSFHILRCISPVTTCIQISQIEFSLPPGMDSGGSASDFTGDESLSSPWAFMIEENSVGGKHAVRFAIVHSHPMTVYLGCTVGTARMKWCIFVLWRWR